jgi:mgtE-like transporter
MSQHWSVRAITRGLLPVLLVLTALEVGSGLVLGSVERRLYRYPTLLVLVPVVIGTAGNLGSVLSARLSTAFHLGTLSFAADDDLLVGNALTTLALALTLFPLVGLGAWGVAAVTADPEMPPATAVAVTLLSGVVLAVVAVVVALAATYFAYRRGADPDDVVLPVVTNVCDVLGVVVLFAVATVLVF